MSCVRVHSFPWFVGEILFVMICRRKSAKKEANSPFFNTRSYLLIVRRPNKLDRTERIVTFKRK